VFIALAVTVLFIALLLWLMSLRMRKASGLPPGRVIYSDAGAWQRNEQSLFSRNHQLVGKPDYLVQTGKGIVPVEVKSGAAPAQPREGHILQLAAYCLLVEEQMGERVTHGIIKYADKQFAVDYTPALKSELLRVMAEMRDARTSAGAHRDHNEPRKCAACGLRDECDERLM
jgi:CRISPR-associated exonuclease Cas4